MSKLTLERKQTGRKLTLGQRIKKYFADNQEIFILAMAAMNANPSSYRALKEVMEKRYA